MNILRDLALLGVFVVFPALLGGCAAWLTVRLTGRLADRFVPNPSLRRAIRVLVWPAAIFVALIVFTVYTYRVGGIWENMRREMRGQAQEMLSGGVTAYRNSEQRLFVFQNANMNNPERPPSQENIGEP